MLDGLIAEGYCDLASGRAMPLADAYEANVRVAHRYQQRAAAAERQTKRTR